MPSAVEDFSFIAKRVHEIRAARYHELGVSPPDRPEPLPVSPQTAAEQAAPPQSGSGGFRYAPGFEHLGHASPTAG